MARVIINRVIVVAIAESLSISKDAESPWAEIECDFQTSAPFHPSPPKNTQMAAALPPSLRDGWEHTISVGAFGHPSLTSPAAIAANAELAGLPAAAITALTAFAAKITADPALLLLAAHLHRKLYRATADGSNPRALNPSPFLGAFPAIIEPLDEGGTAQLYLLLFLDGVPGLREHHAARGIPDDVTHDTYAPTPPDLHTSLIPAVSWPFSLTDVRRGCAMQAGRYRGVGQGVFHPWDVARTPPRSQPLRRYFENRCFPQLKTALKGGKLPLKTLLICRGPGVWGLGNLGWPMHRCDFPSIFTLLSSIFTLLYRLYFRLISTDLGRPMH